MGILHTITGYAYSGGNVVDLIKSLRISTNGTTS